MNDYELPFSMLLLSNELIERMQVIAQKLGLTPEQAIQVALEKLEEEVNERTKLEEDCRTI